ncbi:MAG: hypothetical protein L6265_12205 [Thermoplasmatales archaeon]|nr:hypothetical protein [Thermoplasmatales archaeon]
MLLVVFSSGCIDFGGEESQPSPTQPTNPALFIKYGYIAPYVYVSSPGVVLFYVDDELILGNGSDSGNCYVYMNPDYEPYYRLRTGTHTFYATKDDYSTQVISYTVSEDEYAELYLGSLP